MSINYIIVVTAEPKSVFLEIFFKYLKKVKNRYTNITFILNGGINNLNDAENLLKEFDGVMIGRLIKNNPFILKEVDKKFFKGNCKA